MARRNFARKLRGRAAVRIEQRALAIALQQQLVIVLAMDVEQHLAQLAQLRGGGRAAVHEGARASGGVDGAAHEACAVAFVEFLGREPFAHRRQRGDVEIGAHLGALRPGAHHARIGAVAEREREGIDEDRLARAGLAGQRGEAARQLEVEPVDDHVVADGECSQHCE